ncbi:MAG: hypothetical protein UT05_C0013G0012 [Parcubacteria group bacterium GW2011_GWF2_38_76]|nr:MAG: hypothetical protein UT05_C0013G0012 [Parcubacteria group bacterium GW2011_GWF2_38_76]
MGKNIQGIQVLFKAAGSYNGSTHASGACYPGSSPGPAALNGIILI